MALPCDSEANTAYPLSRHASFLNGKPTSTRLDTWLEERKARCLSVPDLNKLRKEWDAYQTPSNKMSDTRMQIDLLNIRMYGKVKRPQIRLKMGTAQYYSKRSSSSTGNWNEGFVFVISYHAQLFNTIEFDLYDKPHKHWPATKHIGKAKLKISTLAGKSDVFVTFLPIFEYRAHRLLPSDVQSALLETDLIDPVIISKKTGDLNLIGSVQIRIRYHFQQPMTVDEQFPNKRVLNEPLSATSSSSSIHTNENIHPLLVPEDVFHPLSVTATSSTEQTHGSKYYEKPRRRSSYGRGDLAQDESYVDGVFKNRLSNIMSTDIPGSSEASLNPTCQKRKEDEISIKCGKRFHVPQVTCSASENNNTSAIGKQTNNATNSTLQWIHNLISSDKQLPKSSSGRRYGFSQHDSDDSHCFNPDDNSEPSLISTVSSSAPVTDRLAHSARKKAQYIINSVNFGDRDFASQWMQDSFEDVALSHPVVDKLIGLVVSKQTQAMVRAIIKTANSFGQGFRVTGIKLLKAALLVQRFYESLPRSVPQKPVQDTALINNACHYFSFALVAYGWRGLCYLGMYGQYVRGARNRRSNRLAIIRFLNLDSEDLLGYEYALRKGASFQPSYYVALDKSYRAIVLSIRGTWSLYDAITDLVCEYKPWKGGLVHSGMLASAQWFHTNIIPQIFRYIHHHNEELDTFIITGHSLGGGTASLLTMMVADHIEELRNLASNCNFQIHCYNYAPSAVSSSDLGKKYKAYIHSFVCQDDVVGRLSYGTAMKLKEIFLDMISAYGTLGGFKKIMTDPKAREICFDIIAQRRDKLNHVADSMYPSLYIPGEIIHIKRGKETRFGTKVSDEEPDRIDGDRRASTKHNLNIPGHIKTTYTLHHATHEISNEMKLTKTCIEDHMISAYHNAFESLREQLE